MCTAKQFHHMVNHESGLARGFGNQFRHARVARRAKSEDVRAAEAVALFCYQAKKWICAMAGALGGLDTLVFAGGIGENAPEDPRADLRGPGISRRSNWTRKRNRRTSALLFRPTDDRVSVRVIRDGRGTDHCEDSLSGFWTTQGKALTK